MRAEWINRSAVILPMSICAGHDAVVWRQVSVDVVGATTPTGVTEAAVAVTGGLV